MADFEVVRELGSGAFGSVSKVRRKGDSTCFAMKRVNIGKMDEREVQDALSEVRMLAYLRHARVVQLECSFLYRNNRELCIVMELCDQGDLAGRIKKCQRMRRRVDERSIWGHLVDMTEGLAYLHSKNIAHRDIKPANVFLAADGTCKLGDLNVSKLKRDNDLMQTKIGTPYYMAPEVWAGRKYDERCDIWSLGCVIFELAKLEPPFQANTIMALKREVTRGKVPALPSCYSSQLTRILAQMIVTDPTRRLRALEILDHDEIQRRRASGGIQHAPALPEDGEDTELMATIKPPKNRAGYQDLNTKLQQINTQVSSARDGNRSESKEGGGGPRGIPEMKLASLAEDNEAASPDAGAAAMPRNVPRQPAAAAPAAEAKVAAPAAENVRYGVENGAGAAVDDLPPGWKKVPSQSRPGQFSYLNVNTGERVMEKPTRPASRGGPLPSGWKQVPSQSRPGEWVYQNIHTGERIAWRPTQAAASQPTAPGAGGGRGAAPGRGQRPSYR